MNVFNSIEDLARAVKNKLDPGLIDRVKSVVGKDENKIIALYAFNSTGKTRLSNEFEKLNEEDDDLKYKVLCYNVFLEDLFKWDNENYILNFDKNSWIVKLVIDQGLENNIVSNFKNITNSKIEPLFDFIKGEVSFSIASGDEQSKSIIKISKSEESVFIWSIFYTVLETVIDILNTDESMRDTLEFNNLQYIVVDDPVSSIDDTKIILIAIKLIRSIKSCKNKNVKFLITTHHALFYNVILNSFKQEKEHKLESYSFTNDGGVIKFRKQGDSPFGYHLLLKEDIRNAILDNSIERYHFNLFRNLLEKTSNFIGLKNWSDCISGDNKDQFIRLLNLYSHSRLSDLEPRELSSGDRDIFKQTFDIFIKEYFHEINKQ
jgi:CRISPR/Cas system CSM-associated protein Csm2 small subunit